MDELCRAFLARAREHRADIEAGARAIRRLRRLRHPLPETYGGFSLEKYLVILRRAGRS